MTRAPGSLLTRSLRRALRGEQGSGLVETIVVVGGLLMFFGAALQVGLYMMAGNAARGAAQEGARVAAAEMASIDEGISAATGFAAASHKILESSSVTGSRTGDTVTVTVTGRAISLVPIINIPTTQTAVMPVERVTQ